ERGGLAATFCGCRGPRGGTIGGREGLWAVSVADRAAIRQRTAAIRTPHSPAKERLGEGCAPPSWNRPPPPHPVYLLQKENSVEANGTPAHPQAERPGGPGAARRAAASGGDLPRRASGARLSAAARARSAGAGAALSARPRLHLRSVGGSAQGRAPLDPGGSRAGRRKPGGRR